jgi:hypothetical protein
MRLVWVLCEGGVVRNSIPQIFCAQKSSKRGMAICFAGVTPLPHSRYAVVPARRSKHQAQAQSPFGAGFEPAGLRPLSPELQLRTMAHPTQSPTLQAPPEGHETHHLLHVRTRGDSGRDIRQMTFSTRSLNVLVAPVWYAVDVQIRDPEWAAVAPGQWGRRGTGDRVGLLRRRC